MFHRRDAEDAEKRRLFAGATLVANGSNSRLATIGVRLAFPAVDRVRSFIVQTPVKRTIKELTSFLRYR